MTATQRISSPTAEVARDGWVRLTRCDSAGRRAMWARRTDDDTIEVCAGREGDDDFAVVRSNEWPAMFNVLSTALWVVEHDAR